MLFWRRRPVIKRTWKRRRQQLALQASCWIPLATASWGRFGGFKFPRCHAFRTDTYFFFECIPYQYQWQTKTHTVDGRLHFTNQNHSACELWKSHKGRQVFAVPCHTRHVMSHEGFSDSSTRVFNISTWSMGCSFKNFIKEKKGTSSSFCFKRPASPRLC